MASKSSFFSPRIKKIATLTLVVSALVGFVTLGLMFSERKQGAASEGTVRNVLMDRNTREISLDAVESSLKKLSRENRELARQVQTMQEQLERQAYRSGLKIDPVVLDQRLGSLARQITNLEDQIKVLSLNSPDAQRTGRGVVDELFEGSSGTEVNPSDQKNTATVTTAHKPEVTPKSDSAIRCPANYILKDGKCHRQEGKDENLDKFSGIDELFVTASPAPKQGFPQSRTQGKITVMTATSGSKVPEDSAYPKASDDDSSTVQEGIYLPAGSILSGVFINGMDAPTGKGNGKDQFPALIRIKKEAILPNRRRSDVRECFLIVSGYGDLSSERAYLRGELLSCITVNNRVIEGRLDAYVVGPDGFAGVRGTLVSKQGQIIAKSLMSGFLSGLSNAFDVKAVPTISTSSSGSVNYESLYSPRALQGAAASGISSSLNRIADFYLKIAESLYPVIEIAAGRSVDVIVSKGSYLEPLSLGKSQLSGAAKSAAGRANSGS